LRQSAAKLMSRFLLYIAIALGVLAVCTLLVAIGIRTGHTRDVPVGWFGLAGFTPLVFWAVTKSLKRYWKRPAFWFAVAGLMMLHVLAAVAILLRYPQWPLLWFIPVSLVGAGVFVTLLGRLFNDGHRTRSSAGR
jgi:hypothetical protein